MLIVTAAGVSPTYNSRFKTNITTRVFGSLGFLSRLAGLTTRKGSVVRKIESSAANQFGTGGLSARYTIGGPSGAVGSKPAKLVPLGNIPAFQARARSAVLFVSCRVPPEVMIGSFSVGSLLLVV